MLIRTADTTPKIPLTFFAPFNGLGVGARGFLDSLPIAPGVRGQWTCLGGADVDADANRNAERLCGVPFATLDLMSREQYTAFHGREPPEGWTEAQPADIFRAAGYRYPDALMLSPPCKGFSPLLREELSISDRYQALNGLALRGVWLSLEAFKDQLPHLLVLENVERIKNRGRRFLNQIIGLLQAYGYACAETVHDCGEIGNLAQTRRRFLLVARRIETVPNYLYQPECRPLRGVNEVIGRLPMPGFGQHPLHTVPNLAFKTWVRLAFVDTGRDWKSLERLRVVDGQLADLGLQHLGGGAPRPTDDVRFKAKGDYSQYGVNRWTDTAPTMTGFRSPGQGRFSIADPRIPADAAFSDEFREHRFRVVHRDAGGLSIDDVRLPWKSNAHQNKYRVNAWEQPSGTVICTNKGPGSGGLCVADPRWAGGPVPGWPTDTDYRAPNPNDRLACQIISADGTWHRPYTTLEIAALQALFDPDDYAQFSLDGRSDEQIREWLGNAIPRSAARAMGEQFGQALLLAKTQQTFQLSSTKVWVQPLVIALQCGASAADHGQPLQ